MPVDDAPDAALSALPARWAGHERFVVLDTAFGHGERFIALWQAWRAGRQAPCGQLHVIAFTPSLADVVPPACPLGQHLRNALPPATPDLHRLAFEGGALQLLLVVGAVRTRLPQLVARVDAFLIDRATLDGDADPAWPQRLFKAAARLAAAEATLTMPAGTAAQGAGLRAAGFVVTSAAGSPLWQAVHRPRFVPRGAPQRRSPATGTARHALIVGGGLAGCATAWALAEQGWRSTLLDRHDAPAREASGNPAGLFHGIVNANDGAHARFNRAAALEAARAVREAIDRHGVAGSTAGLLRLESTLPDAAAMQAVLDTLGLPAGFVRAVSPAEASALAGIPLALPCWHYAQGGWVQPAGLARSFLERAGERVQFRPQATVDSLQRSADDLCWLLLDDAGRVLAESDIVVLAHAGDAARLLGRPAPAVAAARRVRGQLSIVRASDWPALRLPQVPVVGSGYLLPPVDGCAVFGATSQADDEDASVRAADHEQNLAALGRLCGLPTGSARLASWQGRTAWRFVSNDRLPWVGAVPDDADTAFRERVLQSTRLPGLYAFSALGSRGITWAALGAQVLAALISGAPVPLAAGLLDALDPARFAPRR